MKSAKSVSDCFQQGFLGAVNVFAICCSLVKIGPDQMTALQPGLHSIQVKVKNQSEEFSRLHRCTILQSKLIPRSNLFTLTLQLQIWEFRETPSNYLEPQGT